MAQAARRATHPEHHVQQRVGWLRASVLGANDGIVSTASLIAGVAAAGASSSEVMIAGVAALVAGAMSMAAGEYVSVSSQADAEAADLARERLELTEDRDFERAELAGIYVGRGLTPELAAQVADQLMAADALGAHARDELGITDMSAPRPVQAAAASAASFAAGALAPLLVAVASPAPVRVWAVVASALAALTLLGVLGARAGYARPGRAVLRVVFWGAAAMAVTAAVGALFGVAA